ncbi:MAG TPA: TetR family transcriptional regulator [Solirubrobacteraceae bacterium]|jgi:AcrR family transcriptional regulator|nr:TetR family transcriptional regulator [Solirubrobacteraceae bacterium]
MGRVPRRTTHRRRSDRSQRRGSTATTATTPTTRRGKATRAALIRAGRYIFERDGFLEARITDIAAAADAATGSFYSYFDSKQAVFSAVIDMVSDDEGLHPPSMAFLADACDDLAAGHDPGSGHDLAADVAAHHREWLRHYLRNARLMSVMEEVTHISDEFRRHRIEAAQPFMDANAEAVRCLQTAGLADPALDPLQTARSLSTMVSRSAFVAFVLEEEGEDALDVLVTTLTLLWLNALRIPVDPGV